METKKQTSEKVEKGTSYQCPMHCEKDKVYNHPGDCPVCNMKLIPLNEKSSHDHQGKHCC